MEALWDVLVTWVRVRVRNERAASLVEYALLVALIAIVCIGAVQLLGRTASAKFSSLGGALSRAS
jgi:pilus assembly protein Flp/PilA